ncbi:SGNH/GDSL hydrolase family protein [Nocardia takedensis]
MTDSPRALRAGAALCGAALAAVIGITGGSTAAAAPTPVGHQPAPHGQQYVALGDSGAATTGRIDVDSAAPLPCVQSTANTPKLVADRLGLRLDDRTCSAATIAHLAGSQLPGIAPQFDALGPDTQVVTIHIGANDVPTTLNHLQCLTDSLAGGDCSSSAASWPARTEAIADVYGAALEEIARRAPAAKIFVDGWPTYVRAQSCPAALLTPGAATTLQDGYDALNAVVAREAAEHGAVYIDTRTPGIGHDACAPDAQRWIEPALAADTLMPFHLTPLGMRAVADIVATAIAAHLNR